MAALLSRIACSSAATASLSAVSAVNRSPTSASSSFNRDTSAFAAVSFRCSSSILLVTGTTWLSASCVTAAAHAQSRRQAMRSMPSSAAFGRTRAGKGAERRSNMACQLLPLSVRVLRMGHWPWHDYGLRCRPAKQSPDENMLDEETLSCTICVCHSKLGQLMCRHGAFMSCLHLSLAVLRSACSSLMCCSYFGARAAIAAAFLASGRVCFRLQVQLNVDHGGNRNEAAHRALMF